MKSVYFILLLFTIQGVCCKSFSQLPAIDSLKIIPEIVTTNDIAKIISYSTFNSGGCAMEDSTVNISDKIISVHAFHNVGVATVICKSTDTLNIGLLAAGKYEVRYYLRDFNTQDTFDTDTVYFIVEQGSNLDFTETSKLSIHIFPNPSSLAEPVVIQTSLLKDMCEIKIIETSGNEIFAIKYLQTQKYIIPGNILKPGLYLVRIKCNKDFMCTKKLFIY